MKNAIRFTLFLLLFSLTSIHQSCKKESDLPAVSTTAVTNITQSTATTGGNITSQGGSSVTARGVCWGTSPRPEITGNHTTDGNGTGVFTSDLTGLEMNTTYYVRAYATNSEGTAYGEQVIFTTAGLQPGDPCPGIPTVTDYNGNVYNTVQIGNQCWMKEDLKVANYSDGTAIPEITSASSWMTLYTGARCWLGNDSATYASIYGALYNWHAVTNTSGLCPPGWHVPTHDELNTLLVFSGGDSVAGGALKEAGFAHWNSPNTGATNSSGFTALPGGCRNAYDGYFQAAGNSGTWWTSTPHLSPGSGRHIRIKHNSTNIYGTDSSVRNGYSVRCIKD